MILRLTVGVACVSMLAVLGVPSAYGTTYVARDLRDSGLPILGEARAINGLGQVVGYRYSPGAQGNARMFVWDPDAGATAIAIDGPNPCDINDVGQVAGFSAGSWEVARAFLWTADAGMILLGEPNSGAFAINEVGLVVGSAAPPGQTYHAALWSSGSMLDLGTVGGLYSQAHDINDAGQIVHGRGYHGGKLGSVADFLQQRLEDVVPIAPVPAKLLVSSRQAIRHSEPHQTLCPIDDCLIDHIPLLLKRGHNQDVARAGRPAIGNLKDHEDRFLVVHDFNHSLRVVADHADLFVRQVRKLATRGAAGTALPAPRPNTRR